jgi:hypothetical protein
VAVIGLLMGRAGTGHGADTLSAMPEPPTGSMVAAETAAEDAPTGWRPPMLP